MSDAPETIWAWEFLPEKQNCLTKGGWDDKADRKLAQYIRADIAEARIAELEARPVRVKPLEWVKGTAKSSIAHYTTCEADNETDPFWFVYINGGSAGKLGEHSTEESAKAAAQADYERRIKDALKGSSDA